MPRPTRAGALAAAAVPTLGASAWLLGQPELAIAAAAVAAVLACAGLALARRTRLEVRRRVNPRRVAAGDPCEVRLEVHNVGTRRTPVLRLRDDAGRFGEAVLHVAPIRPSDSVDAVYAFPSHRRGIHPIGPMAVEIDDPFGLLRRTLRFDDVRHVVVRPRTWSLAPLPPAPGEEPELASPPLASSATADEELMSIRPYVAGDDIRRIHWRTTARAGRPMVRHHDQPWQRRCTVLLDTRHDPVASGSDDPAFERAVSVVASLIRRAAEHLELVRLVTTDGGDSGVVAAADRLDELLDQLAATGTDRSASLSATLGALASTRVGSHLSAGRLVVVVAHPTREDIDAWRRATHAFVRPVLVTTATDRVGGEPDGCHVRWDGTAPLGDAWSAALDTHATDVPPPRQGATAGTPT